MVAAIKAGIKFLLTTETGKKILKGILAISLVTLSLFIIIPVAISETINPFRNSENNFESDPYVEALRKINDRSDEAVVLNLDLIKAIEALVIYEDNENGIGDARTEDIEKRMEQYYLNLEEKTKIIVREDEDGNEESKEIVVDVYIGKTPDEIFEILSPEYPQLLDKDYQFEIFEYMNLASDIFREVISGDIIMPVSLECAVYYQPFGSYLQGGDHWGVDLSGASGTPIYAVADGTIVKIVNEFEDSPFGLSFEDARSYIGKENQIKIEHEETQWNGIKVSTRYLHLKINPSLTLKVGDKVYAGDLIGYMGNSGFSTGTHLHFELHENDSPIDPAKYFNLGALRDYSKYKGGC